MGKYFIEAITRPLIQFLDRLQEILFCSDYVIPLSKEFIQSFLLFLIGLPADSRD